MPFLRSHDFFYIFIIILCFVNYKPLKQAYDIYEADSESDSSLSPVIFLHGILGTKEAWKDIPSIIANITNRKVFNLDLRNHGDSEWTEEFDFDLIVKDIVHFMETVKCRRAVMIGHSGGARAIIQMTLQEPDKVEKAIIEEMKPNKLDSNLMGFLVAFTLLAPKALKKVPKHVTEDEATKIIMKNVCSFLPPESVRKNKLEELEKEEIGIKKTANGEFSFKSNLASLSRKLKIADQIVGELSGCYKDPILFIYGKDSSYEIGKAVGLIKQQFPQAEFVGMDGAGHSVHKEKPKEFLDAVLKFLRK